MQHDEIKYVLLDIEFWQHQTNSYPQPVTPSEKFIHLCIGSRYTVAEYAVAEKEIHTYYTKYKNGVAIMNPLYQYDDTLETVITIDLLAKNTNETRATYNAQKPQWFRNVIKIIRKHQGIKHSIHAYGGNLGLKRVHNAFSSKDPALHTLEKHIQKLCAGHIDDLIQFAQDGSIEASIALQWTPKNSRTLSKMTYLFEGGIDTKCANILLRQLIPCVPNMNLEMQKRLAKNLASLLQNCTSNVRNKALCILSDMDISLLSSLPQNCIAFIQNVSTTKQQNCAYPAKEILKKLKAPEM